MAAYFVRRIFHVKGDPLGLAAAQNTNAAMLQHTWKLAGSHHCNVQQFLTLVQNAQSGDLIYYDGHGTFEGEIVLIDGRLTGTQIREAVGTKGVIVVLSCCFAVRVTSHSVDAAKFGENLRNNIATLLAYNSENAGNVRTELNRVDLTPQHVDNGVLASRIALAIGQSGGIDRFALLFGGVIPISVGSMLTINDAFLMAVLN